MPNLRSIGFLLSMMLASHDWALAQQPNKPVIGFLSSQSPQLEDLRLAPFKHGLKEAGFVEGQNVAIEYRWAEKAIRSLTTGKSKSSISPLGTPWPQYISSAPSLR